MWFRLEFHVCLAVFIVEIIVLVLEFEAGLEDLGYLVSPLSPIVPTRPPPHRVARAPRIHEKHRERGHLNPEPAAEINGREAKIHSVTYVEFPRIHITSVSAHFGFVLPLNATLADQTRIEVRAAFREFVQVGSLRPSLGRAQRL